MGKDDDRARGTQDAQPAPPGEPAPAATSAIDAEALARLVHDLRSPVTVLLCNRRFLEEALSRDEVDRDELRAILADDASALERMQRAVAALARLARRSP